jgi:Tat protein secretion system quality control protein TatD with DNase activity
MALMVAIKVAELKGIKVEDVLSQVRLNTYRMYNI